MKVIETTLKDLFIISPSVFDDDRGWFMESYSSNTFKSLGLHYDFIQDNHSYSKYENTLRGLHFQISPKGQAKLVRCTCGAIIDVAVDLRKGSDTFLKWFSIELTAANKQQLLVPNGFAHGFRTLQDNTEVQYKVDEFYDREHDAGILWNDPEINIEWGCESTPLMSEKDRAAPIYRKSKSNFIYEGS